MRTGWRLVKERHIADAFSGDGALLTGGRWNYEGTSVVYAAEHLALSAMEIFVGLNRNENRIRFAAIPFSFPDTLFIEELKPEDLPGEWRSTPVPQRAATKDMGKRWLDAGKSAILRVPSVIIPQEFNFVINPGHPDFRHITIGRRANFSFDPRMWK